MTLGREGEGEEDGCELQEEARGRQRQSCWVPPCTSAPSRPHLWLWSLLQWRRSLQPCQPLPQSSRRCLAAGLPCVPLSSALVPRSESPAVACSAVTQVQLASMGNILCTQPPFTSREYEHMMNASCLYRHIEQC